MRDLHLATARALKTSNREPISARTGYLLRGGLLGFAIGVGLAIATRGGFASSPLWFLVASTIVGSLTGLDLYLTRRWRRIGRFTPVVRFVVACTGATGVTSAACVLLGFMPPQLAWSLTAFAAIGGVLYGVWLFLSY